MVYQNTMISSFFEAWFERTLLPSFTQKSVIILDNACFHRMGILQVMANKREHHILPLTPYSPELHPIECTWANIKRYMRAVLLCSGNLADMLVYHSYFN
ncbi:transposase [Volucribacter amazonae]|uniref:transposase n=1 Tax=Volucribacter amazonae TaxID=256731 RepID=UPI0024413ADC|nr:transposase [Volucribacter amazonae]